MRKKKRSQVTRLKKTDWQRSNIAHKARSTFYGKKKEKCNQNKNWLEADNAFIKESYHFNVMCRQEKLKRKLTKAEKQKSYDNVISTFF